MRGASAAAPSVLIDGCSWTFDGWTDKLAASGVAALNLTVAGAREDFASAVVRIQGVIERIHRDPERLRLARTTSDVRAAARDGRVAIVLNFQNGAPLGVDLGRLHLFWELGVRNVQLTYNERNALGDGCLEPGNAGLSRFGRSVVREMNDLRMVVDLSHAGERTSLDAIELSERPCVFSHANPRALADNPRNLSDEQILACAASGGVIGACAWGPILWQGGDDAPGLDTLVRHIEYLVELAGLDAVAVATDSTSSTRDDHIAAHASEVDAAYPEVTRPFVERFGNTPRHRYPVPVEHLPRLAATLAGRGWKDEEVGKVMGGNLLRVWNEVWST